MPQIGYIGSVPLWQVGVALSVERGYFDHRAFKNITVTATTMHVVAAEYPLDGQGFF